MKNIYFLLLLFPLIIPSQLFAQNICDIYMEPVCSSETFDAEIPELTVGGSVQICHGQSYPMIDVAFYFVKIQEAGTFTFLIHKDPLDDYDFAVWQNPDCTNLGVPDRTSYLEDGQFNIPVTGLALNEQGTCEAAGDGWPGQIFTPGVVRHLDVQVDDEIIIMIYRPIDPMTGEQAGDFTISFGGDAELDCTIVGDSYGKCDIDENGLESFVAADFLTDLNTDFPGGQFEFYLDQEDAENGTGTQATFPHPVNIIDNPSELFVRVEDASGDFMRVVQIHLYVNEIPQLTSPIDLPALCDIGSDGEQVFDLTLAEADLVADPSLYTFKYYESEPDATAGGNNNINPATAYESGTETIYVRVETGPLDGNEEGCFSVGEINLTLNPETETEFDLADEYCLDSVPPTLNNVSDNSINGTWSPAVINTSAIGTTTYTFTPNLNQCATTFEIEIEIVEGVTPQFTLESTFCYGSIPPILPLISENEIEGTWFPSVIDTSSTVPIIYTFTPDVSNCTTIYEIEIEIIPAAVLNNNVQIELCDEDFDGNYTYNLTELNPELINPTTGLIFSYYETQLDFDNDNPILQNQWNNYELINLPTTIIVGAQNQEGCISEPVSVEFVEGQGINLLTGPYEIPFCEGETVDLTDYNSIYTSETAVTFTYYTTLNNAETETSPITDFANYSPSITEPIYVRLAKTGRCPEIIEVEFILSQEVQHNPGQFGPIEFCEEETIDLTSLENDMALESGVLFTYYESQSDAENELNPITDETEFDAAGSGSVFVKLTKTDRCDVILEITFEQRPDPTIIGLEPLNRLICEGEETIEIEVVSEDPNATFVWTWGVNQNHNGATIEITQSGTYVVTVTDSNGCESSKELVITPSPAPVIISVESGNDYLVVSAEASGGGMLEYSLNNVIWQSSPRFDNLVKGEVYTIYVRENGCEVTSYQAVILDVPNFISPNGDGYNDQWTIRGIEITADATIKIFDRYGKIFVDTNFDGNYVWDGKYMGRNIPSGDYWYIMEVPSDGIVPAQKFVGNISIRNQ